jgi:methyl-accepting chemotaxis protein
MALTSPPTSSDRPVARGLLPGYARALAIGGVALVALLLVLDPRWISQGIALAALTAATVVLRTGPVRLSKYSYLTQTGIPALVGILVAAPSTVLLAVGLGTVVGDGVILRKPLAAALINAGREVLALAAATGFFLLTVRLTGVRDLSLDLLPAGVILLAVYFVASRGLFYFSLLVRAKLPIEERLFILRWEVLTYIITTVATVVVVWALHSLAPAGWVATVAALGVVGLLARTIIEEAIAAEDLNKVHLMHAALTGSVSLQTALEQIEQYAYRLLDWDDFRIYRVREATAELLYRSRIGRPGREGTQPALAAIRAAVVRDGRAVSLADARREASVAGAGEPPLPSLVVHPLKFSEVTIGTLELEHRKERFYRPRDLNAVAAIANQVATAIHIAELRRPLLDTVEKIGGQVRSLARAADSLRGTARTLAAASEALRQRAAQQEEFARRGLETTTSLADATASTATSGARAASVSRETLEAAARHRDAIGEAIRRLVEVQGFVARSADHVTALGRAAGRMGAFIASIREVAELTKLIALNATIEAGRAGEEGRAFGVVAEEVQRLAVQTDRTAQEASDLAREIGTEVQGVLGQMEQGQALVAGVGTVSGDAARALDAIVDAAQEAGGQADRIAESAAAGEDAVQVLAGQLRRLADASRQTRGDVDLLAAQAMAATRGQSELEEAIGHLERVAADLQRVARHFVVGP